jgi:SulP family sulfate permease
MPMLDDLRRRFAWERKDRGADLTAGLTTGIAAIPDSMASALLAGINPLVGLYTMIVATPVAALVTSSQMMHVSTTGALSLGVASSLYGIPDDQKLQAVFVLTLMIGLIQAAMGLLKMGFLVRFVPHAVMTGFLNGVAVLIVLSQLANFTGYRSSYGTPVARALDTALNVASMVPAILAVGFSFILLLLVLERVERVSQWAMVLAMIGASIVAALFRSGVVPLVGDVTDVPRSLPAFAVPGFSLVLDLVVPAVSLSIIGLVQGAGISQGYPNPDGRFPNPSGDFLGQGAANVATSFFQGMPAGASISGTALVVNAGARSRWANVSCGVLIAVIVLVFANLVKLIAMPALAALLLVVGFRSIKVAAIRTVWQTGRVPRVVMTITFLGTLMMPLQYAVLLGVATAVLLLQFQGANRIRLVQLVPVEGGYPMEQPVPRQLPSRRVTALQPYGSLFYAAARTLEENLPAAEAARQAAVIFLLRGYDEFGSTMIGVLDRYTRTLQGNGGRLMLAGVGSGVLAQLERTGLIRLIGRENVFLEQPQWGAAANQALEAAEAWLESLPPAEPPAPAVA